MKFFLPLVLMTTLITGCKDEQVNHGTPGFLTQIISEDQFLVGDDIYEITVGTKIQDSKGRHYKASELELGMKIQAFYEGTMDDRLLAKKRVSLLLVLADQESLKEADMMAAVLDDLQEGKDQHFIITDVAREVDGLAYTMYVMKRSNLDLGYTITVDAGTYEILYMEG